MNTLSLPAACLCLATGALLGGVFLAMKLARILLGGGRVFIFVSDLLLGLLCGAAAFTVALAIDKGRLRLFQAALQALGAWGTVCALDPLISGTAAGIRKLAARLRRFLRRRLLRPVGACGRRLGSRLLGILRKLLPEKKRKKKRPARRGRRRVKRKRGSAGSRLPGRKPDYGREPPVPQTSSSRGASE